MKKVINFILCAFVIFYVMYASAAQEFAIKVPVVNMYSKPEQNADVVSQALYGSFVTILETRGSWSLIEAWDDYKGWVSNNAFAKQAHYPVTQMLKVKNLFANIYQEADTTKHAPIFTLPYDVQLQMLGASEDNRWYKVRLVGGNEAWVLQGDVILNPKNLTMKEMLELSHQFIGLPYLWGGTSTYGFDCSGFVQMLYKQMGINLPRDGSPQAAWGGFTEVSRGNLQPGDAIYFGWDNKISHAGIYLGNNLYISSTAYKNPIVQIADLRDPHWRDIYITARRLNSMDQPMPEFRGGVSLISSTLQAKMHRYTWREGCPVAINDLVEVNVSYWGFDNKVHQGSLIVHKELASEVLDIFREVYQQKFPIEKIKPIEEYRGDDNSSMRDNNTSAFSCRAMTDFPDQYSVHSYGRAIDINPLINPYVNGEKIEPAEGTKYADRGVYAKGKITTNDPLYKAFIMRGWQWGGDASWDVSNTGIKDYQHFEKLE